jgi:hypothetical protein
MLTVPDTMARLAATSNKILRLPVSHQRSGSHVRRRESPASHLRSTCGRAVTGRIRGRSCVTHCCCTGSCNLNFPQKVRRSPAAEPPAAAAAVAVLRLFKFAHCIKHAGHRASDRTVSDGPSGVHVLVQVLLSANQNVTILCTILSPLYNMIQN